MNSYFCYKMDIGTKIPCSKIHPISQPFIYLGSSWLPKSTSYGLSSTSILNKSDATPSFFIYKKKNNLMLFKNFFFL